MNRAQTRDFYTMAMACDSRMQPLDDHGVMLQAWQIILDDVPWHEHPEILRRLYGRERRVPLQPGTVRETWEAIAAEREQIRVRIAGIDRYLANFAGEDPAELVDAKRAQRARLAEGLPAQLQGAGW